ncbi:hypothetical protein ACM26_02915 [Helicobacter pylori]|nr:hypothetical protein [Helicobacter pylori]EQL72573.1 hypothetical protein N409_00680 [Helicobacter pylori FD719]KNE10212.1 hypothetical protein ACM26_02915 [Helicobacter pylori]
MVNRKKPTPKKGFYLWFAYYWSNDFEKFYLCIGRSIEKDGEKECQKCLAYDKIIDPNGDAYYQESYDDLKAHIWIKKRCFLDFATAISLMKIKKQAGFH